MSPAPLDSREPRSAALRVFRQARARFDEGHAAIDRRAWQAWGRTIAIGAVAMFALMLVLIAIARRLDAAGYLDRETAALRWIGEHGPFSFSDAVFFQTFGSDITLIVLVGFTAGIAVWARRPITALSMIIAPIVPDIVGRFGWLMWARQRPAVLHEGVASPAFHAFPSGHASKTVATWGFLILIWIAASRSIPERLVATLLLAAIAIVVPVGRMTMGVHWPSDVVAGMILGFAWLAVLAWARRYERKAPRSDV